MAFFALSLTRPVRFLSVTDLVTENARLDARCARLEEAVTSHATVDQAMGVIVTLGQIAPEEAWRALRDVSQRTNTKLRAVAEQVLAFAQGTADLPEAVRTELHQAITRYGGSVQGALR